LLLEYLGSSGGCQSDCNSPAVRDAANIDCENFDNFSERCSREYSARVSYELFLVGGLELTFFLLFTPLGVSDTFGIFLAKSLFGFLGVTAIFWIGRRLLPSLDAIIGVKKTNTTIDRQEVKVSIVAREKEVHQRLEDLLVRSSSEVAHDVESFVAKIHNSRVKRINELIQEIIPREEGERDSRRHVDKEVALLALLSEYVHDYWELLNAENRNDFSQIAFLLFKIVKELQSEGGLKKELFRLYEEAVYRYLNVLCQVAKKNDPDWHLFDLEFFPEDGNGDDDSSISVVTYPNTAEDKAADRMKDADDENVWIDLPKSQEKITAEKVRQHMNKRGYT